VKLSNKGRYGLRAMFDIAFHNRGRATQIKDIAERQAIPPRFLEQIFQDLKKAGLVTSKRGPRGGYQLACAPAEVRLGDILRALEGPVALNDRGRPGRGAPEAGRDGTGAAVMAETLSELERHIEELFDERTIEDLCARAEALGRRNKPPRSYNYVI
jgi:Rrf2 family iron-sulfur cluster assembly transcriptional regulator